VLIHGIVLFQSKISKLQFSPDTGCEFFTIALNVQCFPQLQKIILLFKLLKCVCLFADCINSHVQTDLLHRFLVSDTSSESADEFRKFLKN